MLGTSHLHPKDLCFGSKAVGVCPFKLYAAGKGIVTVRYVGSGGYTHPITERHFPQDYHPQHLETLRYSALDMWLVNSFVRFYSTLSYPLWIPVVPFTWGGLYGVVGIAIRHGLDGLGVEFRGRRDFPCRLDRPRCPPGCLYKKYRVFSENKVAGACCLPPTSSCRVANGLELYLRHLYAYISMSELTFAFTLHVVHRLHF